MNFKVLSSYASISQVTSLSSGYLGKTREPPITRNPFSPRAFKLLRSGLNLLLQPSLLFLFQNTAPQRNTGSASPLNKTCASHSLHPSIRVLQLQAADPNPRYPKQTRVEEENKSRVPRRADAWSRRQKPRRGVLRILPPR